MPDAVVVGSGPNGLAAAITMARAGRSALVVERAETVGGGTRSAELTEPGFVHDVCSAIHPSAAGSPFFTELPLAEHGLELVHPDALARASAGRRNRRHARAVGRGDGRRARSGRAGLPEADRAARPGARPALPFLLGPRPFPRHPIGAARFGLQCLPLRRRAGRPASRASGGRRSSSGSRRTRCSRCAAARLRRSASSSPCSATPTAGRLPAGGRSRSPTHSSPTSGRSAARSRPDGPSTSVDELPPSVVTLLDLTPQG